MSSETIQLPYQPLDSEIEETARNAVANGDLAGLEHYLFDIKYFSQSWVFYTAVAEACLYAKAEHSERMEGIAKRAYKELTDCPPLIEMAIKQVEALFGRLGDEEGRKRLELMGLTLFAGRLAEFDWKVRPGL